MISLTSIILAPTITYGNGAFSISEGKEITKVAIKQPAKHVINAFSMKSEGAVLKWDAKGLSVTAGGKTRSTLFAELPTSPRFFSPEEISNHSSKNRSAVGLSGWEQIGKSLYVVPRWAGADKKTWLEMLVKFDLGQPVPWFETITPLDGTSRAYSPVEDRVFRSGDWLGLVSERAGEWGVSLWPVGGGVSEFRAVGEGSSVVDLTPDGALLRFIETTNYGTRIAGTVSLPDAERSNVAETRDPIFFPGDSADIVQINTDSGVVLRSTESGLELKLPSGVGVRNIAPGVLVWTPRDAPSQAVLYSKSGLRAITRWKK